MNLQELLSYRKCCMIHSDRPLRPYCAGTAMILDMTPAGLSLSFRLLDRKADAVLSDKTMKILEYNFDGTYQIFDRSFIGEIIVYMMCDTCKQENPISTFRDQTSLITLNSNKYFYNFKLDKVSDSELYDGHLIGEVVRYTRNKKFYHLNKNHVSGEADCKMGSSDLNAILDDMLRGMLNLKLPSMDLTRIRDIDHLVDKIKLYNLFS
jgi:hypothetical protein